MVPASEPLVEVDLRGLRGESMSPEEMLKAADRVRERVEMADISHEMLKRWLLHPPPAPPGLEDCGCKSGICMSTNCPRAARITCDLNSGAGWPD